MHDCVLIRDEYVKLMCESIFGVQGIYADDCICERVSQVILMALFYA